MECRFFVGTYAQPNEESIFLYTADFEKREFTKLTSYTGARNPSYLLQNGNGVLYAVEETAPEGNISAFRVGKHGLSKRCTLHSYGADPCHLALDDRERFLFVSNYTSGSLTMFELDEAGIPFRLCCLKQHAGKGPDAARQEGPHVHFAQYTKGLLYVCDLGLDTVFCYRVNALEKTLEATDDDIRLPPGYGPRHLCFHPLHSDWLYVASELNAHVLVYHLEKSVYTLKQDISSLAGDAPAGNRAAAIKMSEDGSNLFVSNRGMDSVTAFAVQENGLLGFLDICPTGGLAPRDFSVFGEYLIVANQDSSMLTVLRFDHAKQELEPLQMRETIGRPVCILKTASAI